MKNRTLRKVIHCKDSSGKPCRLILSVRNREMALRIDGGDEFVHLDYPKVVGFLEIVYAAMDLLMERTPPEEVDDPKF